MKRADQLLVEKGHAASRSEAQAAIRAGLVRVNGEVLDKPSRAIAESAKVDYQKPHPFVSRGGVKLAAALDQFELSPETRICLDIGASTGGFTEVLLNQGASRVYALDVGHGQLHPRLAQDARVISLEGRNARDLKPADFGDAISAIVCDVSFISLKLALPPAMALAKRGAWAVVLVKPQFEVGQYNISKGGIVRDEEARAMALAGMMEFIAALPGWIVRGSMPSPISGGDGNQEFLLAAEKP
jgi:23S rRNA (cytidine1920-2'-O)/16S rRNA (cytidine1409-2'-O)-methyltransferase